MTDRLPPEELLEYPCTYEYKAFGPAADEAFVDRVRQVVGGFVAVGGDSVRTRLSSGGRYQCVSVLVRLESGRQLNDIYTALRTVEGLCYLL